MNGKISQCASRSVGTMEWEISESQVCKKIIVFLYCLFIRFYQFLTVFIITKFSDPRMNEYGLLQLLGNKLLQRCGQELVPRLREDNLSFETFVFLAGLSYISIFFLVFHQFCRESLSLNIPTWQVRLFCIIVPRTRKDLKLMSEWEGEPCRKNHHLQILLHSCHYLRFEIFTTWLTCVRHRLQTALYWGLVDVWKAWQEMEFLLLIWMMDYNWLFAPVLPGVHWVLSLQVLGISWMVYEVKSWSGTKAVFRLTLEFLLKRIRRTSILKLLL